MSTSSDGAEALRLCAWQAEQGPWGLPPYGVVYVGVPEGFLLLRVWDCVVSAPGIAGHLTFCAALCSFMRQRETESYGLVAVFGALVGEA